MRSQVKVIIKIKVSVRAICLFVVKDIAAISANAHSKIGKYGDFEYIFFSSFVVFASIIPNGTARISAKYSIIRFLRGDSF
jgi:hypothetical protein